MQGTYILTEGQIEGRTRDFSQGGAFIEISSWSAFRDNDQVKIQLFLPPEFTGQRETMVLVGPAVIKRIERDTGGMAVQYSKELTIFEVLYQPIFD